MRLGIIGKRMPDHTYIQNEAKSVPGFKAYEGRLILLPGVNVAD